MNIVYYKNKKIQLLESLDFIMEGLVGFEPTLGELQSHALPLGYSSIQEKLYQIFLFNTISNIIFYSFNIYVYLYPLMSITNFIVLASFIDESNSR